MKYEEWIIRGVAAVLAIMVLIVVPVSIYNYEKDRDRAVMCLAWGKDC